MRVQRYKKKCIYAKKSVFCCLFAIFSLQKQRKDGVFAFFLREYLRMSKKSSNFALAFGKIATRSFKSAVIAQLVEHDLAKVGVASSSLVHRSSVDRSRIQSCFYFLNAQVAELVDAYVSGAYVARRAGSSPVLGTIP